MAASACALESSSSPTLHRTQWTSRYSYVLALQTGLGGPWGGSCCPNIWTTVSSRVCSHFHVVILSLLGFAESMAAADAAHWRAMQSIAQLCMRIGIGTDFPSRAFLGTNLATTLRWLAALDRASLALEHAPEAASEQQRAHATLSRVPSVVRNPDACL